MSDKHLGQIAALEMELWRRRANRLRSALLDIISGQAEDAKARASSALEFEREVSEEHERHLSDLDRVERKAVRP